MNRIKRCILLTLVSILLSLSPTTASAGWNSSYKKAVRLFNRQKFPMARYELKKTCITSLKIKSWKGVYRSVKLLLKFKGNKPLYFHKYIDKASLIASRDKNPLACLRMAEIYSAFSMNKKAVNLLNTAHSLYLNMGKLRRAILTSRQIMVLKETENAMAKLIKTAQIAYDLDKPSRTLLASSIMIDFNIKTAARYWINKTCTSLVITKKYNLIIRAIKLLEKAGYKKDALYWEEQINMHK
ncbi:MAG: hypothetical protein KAR07_05280 [Spirochaetes bacterium]|nr:hypothetical protein [Spirochaetota bacterium]MCK5267557.1 hypothetical protein [Spirochaetota bacterium]